MEEEINVIQHQVAEEEAITAQLQERSISCLTKLQEQIVDCTSFVKKRKLEHLKNITKRIRLNINTLWDTLCEKEITIERECRLLGHVCTTYFIYQHIIIFFHVPISF